MFFTGAIAGATCSSSTTCSFLVGEQFTTTVTSSLTSPTWAITSSYPSGFWVIERTGIVVWTPTPDQVGTFGIDVKATSGSSTETIRLTLTVTANPSFTIDASTTIFVSPTADLKGTGTYLSPYSYDKLGSKYCGSAGKIVPTNMKLYFRGGLYTTLAGNNPSVITCSGESFDKKLVIKPWGNEHAILSPTGSYGIQFGGNNIEFSNFEVRGYLDKVTLDQAIKHWWEESTPKTDDGYSIIADAVLAKGSGIYIHHNIVHDWPGNGIKSDENAFLLTLEDNIVFNTGWYSTRGVGGIGVMDLNDKAGEVIPTGRTHGVIVQRNLVYGVSSRVISHVFSKGSTTMDIDEGSASNAQQNLGGHTKGYLFQQNFYLWNGKGPGLRAIAIDFRNNTLYRNGNNLCPPSADGIRAQNIQDGTLLGATMSVDGNAVEALPTQLAVKFGQQATFLPGKGCTWNLMQGGFSNSLTGSDGTKCAPGTDNNLYLASGVFRDPDNLDFTTNVRTIGAPVSVFAALKARLDRLGYTIGPNDFQKGQLDSYIGYVKPIALAIMRAVPGSPTITYWSSSGVQQPAPSLVTYNPTEWANIATAKLEWVTVPNYSTAVDTPKYFSNPYYLNFNNVPDRFWAIQGQVTPNNQAGYISCTNVAVKSTSTANARSTVCTAYANSGYTFTRWSTGCVDSTSTTCSLTAIASDMTVTAVFTANQVTQSSDSSSNSTIAGNDLWIGLIVAGSILVAGILIAILYVRLTILRAPPAPKEEPEGNIAMAKAEHYRSLALEPEAEEVQPTETVYPEGESSKSAVSLNMDNCIDAMDELDEMERHHSNQPELIATNDVDTAL